MIVDSSAVLAVLFGEPEQVLIIEALERNTPIRMSAASYLEVAITLEHRDAPILERQFESFISDYSIIIEDVTRNQVVIGRIAYRAFGRRSGHPAKLNFGDCFTYALAADIQEPLLCKGNDFIHTDLEIIPISGTVEDR